jgi:branched-chain amino acid transport system permease protein
MSLAVQVIFTGLSAGGVYGLVAIGYSLLYRLTGIVYFALGDLIGLGAFPAKAGHYTTDRKQYQG